MMGEEGKPGKKVRLRGRGKRPDRPPENPVVDVSKYFSSRVNLFKVQKPKDMSIFIFIVSFFSPLEYQIEE